MTAAAPAHSRGDDRGSTLEFPVRPAEGWLSLVLITFLAAVAAWSISDAKWILGRDDLTAFLPWAAAFGVAWGFISAKVGWSRWLSHLLGAVYAALILPMIVGTVIDPQAPNLGVAYQVAAASAANAYLDLAWRGLSTTQNYGHFMLVLGAICWGTGQFAAFALYRHHRPIQAVFVIGLVFIANMSLTNFDQFDALVVFSAAALVLLILGHIAEERSLWLRHRVWEGGTFDNPYMAGGSFFVLMAVVASLVLTATASSAPLANMWLDVNQRLIEFGQQIQGILPSGGSSRIAGISFGTSTTITGTWVTDNTPILTIHVPDDGHYYWRAIAYDRFTGRGWTLTQVSELPVSVGSTVLAGSSEGSLTAADRRTATFKVTSLTGTMSQILSPNLPLSVSSPTKLESLATSGQTYFGTLVPTSPLSSYTLAAKVQQLDPSGNTGLTANKLRAAGTSYPAALRAAYTEILPGTVGTQARALATTIVAESGAKTPYDTARAIESYLRDPANFTYDTDISSFDCSNLSAVDCFVLYRHGYCEYYASTMVMMLRLQGIPARMVEGFLPGTPDAGNNETILRSSAHAWVEVYFPGYGWIEFDPTGGGIGQSTSLPTGGPVASPSPSPSPGSSASGAGSTPRRRIDPGNNGSGTGAGSTTSGAPPVFVPVTLGLALVVLGLAFAAFRRSGGRLPQPDAVYRGVVSLAGRLGYAPRPTQTVYEYVGMLGEALPTSRPDLEVVGRAKVEVAYGHHALDEGRLRDLGAAQRRLRVRLLRLLWRRRPRDRDTGTGGTRSLR